uniref:Uncharacterized protein n=1 Tax=Triticum urartu TaxID=4572 RepID=A0A8R7QAV8_TRIUA
MIKYADSCFLLSVRLTILITVSMLTAKHCLFCVIYYSYFFLDFYA